MTVSKEVARIYNTYLAVSRSSQNKPFKLRKDFSKFVETKEYGSVKKIEYIFNKYPEIKIDHFFKAPYALHPNEIFDLHFYTTLKAIKCYKMYMTSLDNLPYDHDYQLKSMKESLQFIREYCKENSFNDIQQYATHSANGLYPDWFVHVKNRAINSAVMFGFSNIRAIIEKNEKDFIDLLVSDFYNEYYSRSSKFKNSIKAQKLVKKGLEIIQEQINIS